MTQDFRATLQPSKIMSTFSICRLFPIIIKFVFTTLRDNLLALNQSDRQDNSLLLTVSVSCSNDLEEQYAVESSANRIDFILSSAMGRSFM